MINLLSDSYKREIRAGRMNVILLRYIMMLIGGIVLLSVLIGGSYVVLTTARSDAQSKVNENRTNLAKYSNLKTQADAFRSDLSTAKTIFDKEIQYSKLIYKIADIIPRNVVLDSLTLDPSKVGSSATMNASAKSYDDAVNLKKALIANGNIFTDVSFDTLNNGATAEGTSDPYPVKVSLKVTIQKAALS
jgi:Tfp pilus assembly protein PilN